MNGGREGVRRVLVAIEVGRHSEDAIEAAARLAGGTAAELMAIFVEDENLHRLAALPIARVVGYPSAAPRDVDAEAMARALQAGADRAAARVQAAAKRVGVPSSFRVARGHLAPAVVQASSEADLVLLGKGRAPGAFAHGAVSTARAVAERARRPVVLVSEGRTLGPPAVVYDGSATSERALAAAAYLGRHAGGPARVLATGATPEAARAAGDEARAWLASRGLEAKVEVLPALNAAAVLRVLVAARAGTLVVGAEWPAGTADLARLLEEAPLPVMIAR
jgi:hypothetical protein